MSDTPHDLNTGRGRCRATARMTVLPVRAVIELGAAPDVLARTLAAVHHVNRRGDATDFIAVALVASREGRVRILPGEEIELIGSESSLAFLLATEGLATLLRRGMIVPPRMGAVWREAGEAGAAYVRDRHGEKWTEGGIARMRRRAERRGVALRAITRKPVSLAASLTLTLGTTPLHVREVAGIQDDGPLEVSTYGFSSPAGPAFLPVMPVSARLRDDAA